MPEQASNQKSPATATSANSALSLSNRECIQILPQPTIPEQIYSETFSSLNTSINPLSLSAKRVLPLPEIPEVCKSLERLNPPTVPSLYSTAVTTTKRWTSSVVSWGLSRSRQAIGFVIGMPGRIWNNPIQTYGGNINPIYSTRRKIAEVFSTKTVPQHQSLLAKLSETRALLDRQQEESRQRLFTRDTNTHAGGERTRPQSRLTTHPILPLETLSGGYPATPRFTHAPENHSSEANDPNIASRIPQSSIQQSTPADDQEEVDLFNAQEKAIRQKLIRSTVLFTSHRFFHESILGKTPQGMDYYNKIVNASQPREFYVQQLDFLERIVALILLPLIEWVISLIFSYKEDRLSGIANIAEQARNYFADPAIRAREFETFLETVSEYFYKLHYIMERFHAGDAGIRSLRQFMEDELDKDFSLRGFSKKSLYENAHSWFVKIINVESEIPCIGGLLDKIIRETLKPVLDKVNILQTSIANGFGSISSGSAFSYSMMEFIANLLKNWTIKLKAENTKDTNASPDPNFFSVPENPEDQLTERQKQLLQSFFQRLIKYLPFENANMEDIAGLLQKETQQGKQQKEILEGLENLFVQVIHSLHKGYADPKQQGRIWIDFLSRLQTIYDPLLSTRSASECRQIQTEAKANLHKFLEIALEIYFQDEYYKSTHEKEAEAATALTSKTRQQSQQAIENLKQIEKTINLFLEQLQIDGIEHSLYTLLGELKELLSNLFNNLATTFDAATHEIKIKMPWTAEQTFLGGIDEAAELIQKISNLPEILFPITQALKCKLRIQEITSSLSPSEAEVNEKDILPGVSKLQFDQWKRELVRYRPILTNIGLTKYAYKISELAMLIHEKQQAEREETAISENFLRVSELMTEIQTSYHSLKSSTSDLTLDALDSSLKEFKNRITEANTKSIESDSWENSIELLQETFNQLSLQHSQAGLGLLELPPFDQLMNLKISLQLAADSRQEKRNSFQLKGTLFHQFETKAAELETLYTTLRRQFMEMHTTLQNKLEVLKRHLEHIRQLHTQYDKENLDESAIVDLSFQKLVQIQSQCQAQPLDRSMIQIGEDLENLLTLVIDTQNEFNECCLISKNEKGNFKDKLILTLGKFNDQLAVHILNDITAIKKQNSTFSTFITQLEKVKARIKDPNAIQFFPFANTVKRHEQSTVDEQVRGLAYPLLELFMNPLHTEQVLLQGVLVRLMPEAP